MDDDEDFLTRPGGRDNNTSQNRLWNVSRDDDDVSMAAPPPLEEDEEETPLKQLIHYWMNERHVPDVHLIAEVVLSGLLNHIRRQVGEMIYIFLSSSNAVCDMGFYSLRPSNCRSPIPRLPRKSIFELCSLRLRSSRSSLMSDRAFVRGCSR